MRCTLIATALFLSLQGWLDMPARAQSIGYIEKYALAEDRTKVLQELIPGSEEFFFYHTLDFQNQGKLAEAEGMLTTWSTSIQLTALFQQMQTRQRLLTYSNNQEQTLEYLRNEMGLGFDHAPPQADRAKNLPTELDPKIIDSKSLLDQSLAQNPGLEGLNDAGLLELLTRELSIDQTRILLQRLTRVDLPNLLPLIEKELKTKDSRGWGAFGVHQNLTLEQRQKLAKSNPKLLEHDGFVRQYLVRLLPNDDVPASDMVERRAHLQRLEDFTSTLPSSQNSLKASVLYQRLLLDAAEENFDRARFEKYLALPRNQGYYSQEYLRAESRTPLVELNANYIAETRFPPIANDDPLIRRYLEHYFKSEETVDRFSKWLDRGYLESILIETKILFGIGSSNTWYAKLNPQQQRDLRDRVELRFAGNSQNYFQPSDTVKLNVDVKNVPKLIVRIYQLNPRNIYRKQRQAPSTDIDLDGLVANSEQTLEYEIAADRRHREVISLPQCEGRGVWVIDLLGGGLRSRAMVIKGQLRSTQQFTDAGHELRIYDESGKHVPSATVEMGTQTFTADEDGGIVIPYGEQPTTVPILLVDGASATVELFVHLRESYTLEMGVLMDSQNLLSGAKGSLIIRPRLLCNGRPVAVKNLEEVQLTILTTDQDGTKSSQVVSPFKLEDNAESIHQFLVPQRLRTVELTLSGKILALSRHVRETLSVSKSIQVNDTTISAQNSDFYLIEDSLGYRLQVRGRNGEPVSRLPVTLFLATDLVNQPTGVTLATDAKGEVTLGALKNVVVVRATAEGIMERSFALRRNVVDWPSQINVAAGEGFELPWSASKTGLAATDWTLIEIRGQLPYAEHNKKLSLKDGRLVIAGLDAGRYFLTNHRSGSVIELRSAKGQKLDGFIVGASQSLEASKSAPSSVISTEIKDGKLRIKLGGVDETTRLHLVATSFMEDTELSSRLRMSLPFLFRQGYAANPSFYIDSLKLDEEYQYILQRQYATKYPGNLLSQPSLLLNPWDTVTTANAKQEASRGDMPPPASNAPMAADAMNREFAKMMAAPGGGRSFFEFLANSAIFLANRRPNKEGWIELPIEGLKGYHSVTAVVVDGAGIVSQTIALPASEFPIADLRLAKSFAGDKHLSQQQRARVVPANAKTILGDARSTRIQTYTTIADIYRLYSTLAPSPELEKFRVLTRWHQLKDDEKQRVYSELACHELNLFVFMKDRTFFDKVVKPYLDDKYQPQLMDRFLLGQDLETYRDLWQRNRLNMFERIALGERIEAGRPGIRKSIADATAASPVSPELRMQRFLAALAGSTLDMDSPIALSMLAEDSPFAMENGRALNRMKELRDNDSDGVVAEMDFAGGMPGGGGGGFGGGMGGMGAAEAEESLKEEGGAKRKAGSRGAAPSKRAMLGRAAKPMPFFQSLDTTREWAESQYYRTRIGQQDLSIIPAGPIWLELSKQETIEKFLSTEFHLSNRTLTEALVALAVLDLPFATENVQIAVEDGQWTIQSPTPCVAFVESIEESKADAQAPNILVGQDIYLVSPAQAPGAGVVDPQAPLTGQALVRGIAYRANVVATNPSSTPRTFSILTQIPQGALPLEGGKFVKSHAIRLEPYSTQQIQYSFYFPNEGEFSHYGAQASIDGVHAAASPESKLKVLNAPEGQATDTWAYVSQWGTNAQVLAFLAAKNAQLLDLEPIAFRMHDKEFFESCTSELESQGIFHNTLWSYSVFHKDAKRIAQFLAHRPDMIPRMGPILKSPIVDVDSWDRYDYEHLDYRPLVNARSHQLGAERLILNDKLKQQYQKLIQRVAYQAKPSNEDRLALTYYMILQGRIDESIANFDAIQADALNERLQYDYFDAYLDFYRGRYDRAAGIADKYAQYGVTRWRDLFAQVRLQVAQRKAMIDGTQPPVSDTAASDLTDPIQRLLIDARQSQQANLASDAPAMDLLVREGKLVLNHQNLKKVAVRYYLMDIELLFSRNPFVQQEGGSLMSIQPNKTEELVLAEARGKKELELPKELANRNVLVEVTSGGLTQSQVLYANSMDVTLVDSYGRLQVKAGNGQPVETAYVKVYARHQGGQVRFFKDGYTDLRGQFDYASLSTNDLNTVERFAILILHPEKGAMIREVAPPKR